MNSPNPLASNSHTIHSGADHRERSPNRLYASRCGPAHRQNTRRLSSIVLAATSSANAGDRRIVSEMTLACVSAGIVCCIPSSL